MDNTTNFLQLTNISPSHLRFRQYLQNWFQTSGILPIMKKWETYSTPDEISRSEHDWVKQQLGQVGILGISIGPGPHLQRLPQPNIFSECNIDVNTGVDIFHTYIMTEERARLNIQGPSEGMMAGIMIGFAVILHYGKSWLHHGDSCVIDQLLLGKKHLALGITEPGAGSDVASITTRGIPLPDGSGWLVSGVKKFITGSIWADYFTTLVRIEGKLTMLLIERSDNITVRYVPTPWGVGGLTGLVIFENVFVPARNLLGEVGDGLRLTLQNFNAERLNICANVLSVSRYVTEHCLQFCLDEIGEAHVVKRDFLKFKLAEMISEVTRVDAWFYKLAWKYEHFQLPQGSKLSLYEARNEALGGEIALLKYRTTRMSQLVAEYSKDIYEWHGISWMEPNSLANDSGRLLYQFKILAVGGGSEEIMLDLGIRQAMRGFPKNARL
jgi:alkylation response protein AidB-like acyl-CoA dehydrogenase